ncbi:thiamine pyrophosphate-binding protein [Aquibium sp. LZ166]|uniref:Thiamine pyrophosphate-binding protein n=1 Tax=Aquibium pacificus TaxID=3153579 RepID=A0ABV3SIH0_9HYPH
MTEQGLGALISGLKDRGVRHIFGIPGGDCALDIIDAAEKAGIRYVLCRTENAGGISAAVTAEITGGLGVIMTTRGPGLTSAVNGMAYAHLDRAALLLIADHFDPDMDFSSHQRIDQTAILQPLLRGAGRLDGAGFQPDLPVLLDQAFGQPNGPIYLEVTNKGMTAPVSDVSASTPRAPTRPEGAAIDAACKRLADARRPVIIVGSQSCDDASTRAVRSLAEAWNVPVYTTYRAKGVMADSHPLTMGHYIGGVAEEAALREADLMVMIGFDAVEFPPSRWRYNVPVIEVARYVVDRRVVEPEVSLIGDIAASLDELSDAIVSADWDPDALAATKRQLHAAGDSSGEGPISPQMVVDAARRAAPSDARIALDAGAHMLPVLHHWVCDEPRQTLLSRGLATMGFALPAALGSCLVDPSRRAIAFTGDGGLMMCAGELATAAQHGCRPVTVVFNDSSLTLISAKQERRQFASNGVDFSPSNFAKVAEGYGCAGFRVEVPDELDGAFEAAFASDRPAVVDIVVNPHGYRKQLLSLRG